MKEDMNLNSKGDIYTAIVSPNISEMDLTEYPHITQEMEALAGHPIRLNKVCENMYSDGSFHWLGKWLVDITLVPGDEEDF
jgi:hypothetical protein